MPRHIRYRYTHLVNLFSPMGACLRLPKHSRSLPGVLGQGKDPDALFTYDHLPLHLPDPDTRISLTGLLELPGSPNQACHLCTQHIVASPLCSSVLLLPPLSSLLQAYGSLCCLAISGTYWACSYL